MPETQSGERSLTSPCGNVTVTGAPGQAPEIELADGAVRMFARDLADLVTATARAATDALNEAIPPTDAPSTDDAIGELAGLRDGLRRDGLFAMLDRRRTDLGEPEDGPSRQGSYLEASPRIALPDDALRRLDSTLELLARFKEPASGLDGATDDGVVNAVTSDSRLVTVEASPVYPVFSVRLSKHACEIGPKALGAEITETAAAAVEGLAPRQNEYLTDMGLPMGPGQADKAVDETARLGDEGASLATEMHRQQERITRMFYEGGSFG